MKVGIHLITKTRIHTSGTNNAGLGPVAFLIAVRISIFVRPARGCMESKVLPNVS